MLQPVQQQLHGEVVQRADKALQARAWDPGLRFDRADVPVAWIIERYGKHRLQRIRDGIVSYGSDGTVELKAETEEVADYYNLSEGMPPSWLFLTYGGCTMEWHVSLSAVDNPVLLYDTDGYTFGEGLTTAFAMRPPHYENGCGPGLTAATSGMKSCDCSYGQA
ncbi:hypothetical protein ACFWJU_37695 [Streptomyces mutabilis]|uniref:hypothetical protein n=1 Tax=Streptomyces mutabilis TaxID=67332 RepID=UPI0036611F2E